MTVLPVLAHYAPPALAVLVAVSSALVGLTDYPQLQTWGAKLLKIANAFSVLTHADSPGTLKMPFTQSVNPQALVDDTPTKPTKLPPAAMLLALLATCIVSCACFSAASKDTPACVALNAVIECSQNGAVSQVVPVLADLLDQLIQQQSYDWQGLLAKLEGYGIQDAGCIVAALIDHLASTGHPSQASELTHAFDTWRAKKGVGHTKWHYVRK